jgi:hypothetical protein
MLQEAGLSMQPPVPPISHKPLPIWRKVPGWVYGLVVSFSVAITVLEGYPWLSIQENTLLDSADPYSQMFSISNQGYIPLTGIDVHCIPHYVTSAYVIFDEFDFAYFDSAEYLGHSETVTVPCFDMPQMVKVPGNKLPGATLEIIVDYSLYHLKAQWLRRSQYFYFKSVQSADKSQHWQFLPRQKAKLRHYPVLVVKEPNPN